MGDGVRIDAYRRFLREAVGLTAIDRIDLVLPLTEAYQADYPDLLADRNTDVEGYLQPLSGKTTLDLVV
ncbi:hypothetical protein [Agreia bicolorata]|uniref:Uncharacterized protein n=1 Tax=Agreia bicolorata TaxID=110935 RepID=A0ABR5CGN2_9MICO|nr:hypothetical protein [Agreia bicolorata]KJC64779.1 hypothetical protein TZ00_03565 [Agreia bicolorata]